jgi:hypothetical protein
MRPTALTQILRALPFQNETRLNFLPIPYFFLDGRRTTLYHARDSTVTRAVTISNGNPWQEKIPQ